MKRKFNAILLTMIAIVITCQLNAQVPYGLNSLPGAGVNTPTIFLDFDGQTVISPYWNGGNPIFAQPTTLTNAQMIRVFNQVAEDYRPFTLNITTDSAAYFAAPLSKRMRIIVTTTSAWYGSAGGVAYIDAFNWGAETPGWVFSALLVNNDKRIAEAASHEAGHTLGLYHQSIYNSTCSYKTEYDPGVGTAGTETSWAPIMGYAYSRNLTLWNKGTSSKACTHIQDDIAVIASTWNGVSLRTDEYGDTRSNSSNINFIGNQYAISGMITQSTDIDYFKLNLSQAGRLTLDANPFRAINTATLSSPNIDLKVTIEKADGSQLSVHNPLDAVKATFDTSLDAGTYYIKVNSTSNANTTNYGMIGSYNIIGTFTAGGSLPVYSLVLNGNNNKGKHELSWNIVADEALESVTVETSEDGRSFTKLQDVNSNSRAFAYQPVSTGNRFYRLHVVTASQLKYYSNVINIKSSSNEVKFNILNNRVTGNEIVAQSKGNYTYRLLDMGGRNIQSGRVNIGFNRISSPALKSGMYLIQIIDGTEVTTERLMVQ